MKKSYFLFAFFILVLSSFVSKSQPTIDWEKTYGEKAWDGANAIVQTDDSCYIIAGYTNSKGAGLNDLWIVKVDSKGKQIWEKFFGGDDWDGANSIIKTNDGNFAIAGYSAGNVLLLKIDKDGNFLWHKIYGSDGDEGANSLIEADDGGFVIVGGTYSKGAGDQDIWMIRTDKDGKLLWDKTFGGAASDIGNSVIKTDDGGFLIIGDTESKGAGGSDIWLIKTDKNGNMTWNYTYGGINDDFASSVIKNNEGDYLIAGSTGSKGSGYQDFWLIKIDNNGKLIWDKTFGNENGTERANTIVQTPDDGYALAGFSYSKKSNNDDIWFVTTDKNGNMTWNKNYGGNSDDIAYSLIITKDGGFAIAGSTFSKGAGEWDMWLIKFKNNSLTTVNR